MTKLWLRRKIMTRIVIEAVRREVQSAMNGEGDSKKSASVMDT